MQSAIDSAFCHPQSTHLEQHLGAWVSPYHHHHLVFSLDLPRLWNITISTYTFHSILYVGNGRFRFSPDVSDDTIPDLLFPVTLISSCADHIIVRLATCEFPASPPLTHNILDELSSPLGWRHFLLEHLHVPTCHDDVVTALLSASQVSVPSLSDSPLQTLWLPLMVAINAS